MNYHSDKFVLYTLSGCALAFQVGEICFGGRRRDSNCVRNLNLMLSSCLTYLMADMYSGTSIYRFSRGWRNRTMNAGKRLIRETITRCK